MFIRLRNGCFFQISGLPAGVPAGILGYIDSALDLHNFLGAFAPRLFLALCIAVYSKTPLRAGVNVFLFFAGMVSGYYLYCNFAAGFFPESYAMIWVFLHGGFHRFLLTFAGTCLEMGRFP